MRNDASHNWLQRVTGNISKEWHQYGLGPQPNNVQRAAKRLNTTGRQSFHGNMPLMACG
jgi:hypothetical protein